MIINNKHVQGIFLYSNDIEFEKGDFVVLDDSIYICTAKSPTNKDNNTVSGRNPEEDSENFNVYLGDKISSVDEYYEYVKNMSSNKSIGSDKYISSHTLNNILNNLMFGINENGIITEYVLDDGRCSTSLGEYIKNISEESVLDRIIKAEKINNGMIRISRELVKDLIGLDKNMPNTLDGKSIILKQYTYLDENDEKIRVQEIIDHIKGIVIYRYCKGTKSLKENTWNFDGGIVPWKHSYLNSQYLNDVNSVYNFYKERIEDLNRLKKDLVNNFKYSELELPAEKTNKVTLYSSSFGDINSFKNGCVITIGIQRLVDTDIFRNDSITIDLADSLINNPITNYYIDDDVMLILSEISESKIDLTISSGVISDIFYRSKFK